MKTKITFHILRYFDNIRIILKNGQRGTEENKGSEIFLKRSKPSGLDDSCFRDISRGFRFYFDSNENLVIKSH